jgi:acyl-CoA carboxylase epsilon subunit
VKEVGMAGQRPAEQDLTGQSPAGRDSAGRGESPERPQRPLLRVVRGQPDDAELAALTTVVGKLVVASAAHPTSTVERSRSAWGDRAALLRKPLPHGPGAWRASARGF